MENKFESWYELAETANKDSLNAFVKTVKMGVTDVESLVHATISSVSATVHAITSDYNLNDDFLYILSVLIFRRMNGLEDGFTNILDYNDMLDPSKRHIFERTITQEVFEDLQEKAEQKLQQDDLAPEVRYHLENIRKGRVPFGYELTEDIMYTNPRTYEILAQQEAMQQYEYAEEEPNEIANYIDEEDETYTPFMQFDTGEKDEVEIIEEYDEEDDEEEEDYYSDPVFQEPDEEDDYDDEIEEEEEEEEEDERPHMSLEQAMALLRRTQMELDEQNSLIGDDF